MPRVIVIDEPELGLHPYAITMFAEMVKQVSSKKQIIISTQSVELLNEFDVEDVVMASYVCFTFNNKEHCLKGADGGYSYNDNVEILREYMEYMNLPISNYHPGCNFSDSVSKCYSIGLVDGYRSIEVYSNGNIIVEERDGVACRIYPNINSNEESYCYEMPE